MATTKTRRNKIRRKEAGRCEAEARWGYEDERYQTPRHSGQEDFEAESQMISTRETGRRGGCTTASRQSQECYPENGSRGDHNVLREQGPEFYLDIGRREKLSWHENEGDYDHEYDEQEEDEFEDDECDQQEE